MNVEDGYDLPLRVTFEEEGGDPYWHYNLAVLPHVGDRIILGSAPKGVKHIVCAIDHHVGAASHRIVIAVRRVSEDPASINRRL